MNKTCGIVRDLMPLVIDHVSCRESSDLVETHVAICPECAEYFNEMKTGVPAGDENEKKEETAAFSQAARKLKHKHRWRTVRIILISIVAAFVLFVVGTQVYRMLQNYAVPMYTGNYRIFLSQLQDGSVVATADYNESPVYLSNWVEDVVEKDPESGETVKIAYLRVNRTLIPNPMYYPPMQNTGFALFSAEDMDSGYSEIRQGTPGDYKTLWKKGSREIEKASAEMEEYYFWHDLLNRLSFNTEVYPESGSVGYSLWVWHDALLTQQNAVEATVPEWQPWHGYPLAAERKLDAETVEWLLSQLESAGIPVDRSKIQSLDMPAEKIDVIQE